MGLKPMMFLGRGLQYWVDLYRILQTYDMTDLHRLALRLHSTK